MGGSELSDMAPILKSAKDATGVSVLFDYTGITRTSVSAPIRAS